ncbi:MULTISPECIES: polymer-forming cytoskeletal protein [unclassified Polynucleobacter]|jgi:cytoskeletal protein CcmA (bactofilin family)|uniref:bactofilin family protein n=1 Tax=unclassified Polynucleobacter TaxID=2640945 RepID=UPI001C0DD2C9|nr:MULTISPECIES: polymer-forming cytoskeletal protein [unclassified Polynucleobacter]MBU3603234.1 polymer-forming cytoskeletal protein [Polynucleobacter sp. AP-Kaivos-20-H2]MBU3621469.1 polymer-forming cytoskeletal protein [Polynucleobacter sp. CS-Odin-A6]
MPFQGILGEGSTIEGKLEANGNFRILGKITGDILEADGGIGILVIDKSAHIQGNIYWANLIIVGTVDGNIFASGSVEIYPSAIIRGDIQCKQLNIHPEAKVNGRLNCFDPDQKLADNLQTVSINTNQSFV